MDQNDRDFIEALLDKKLGTMSNQFDNKLGAMSEQMSEQFDKKLGAISERFDRKLEAVKEDFKQHVSVVSEDFDLKIGMLADGHKSLAEKLEQAKARDDRMETKLDSVELRVIKLSADLAAHRSDTEAHGNIYSVKERGD